MLKLAGVPFMRGECDRQPLQCLVELLEAAIPSHVDASRERIDRRDSNPTIFDKLFQRCTCVNYLFQSVGRCLDYEKNSDRLVDFNHLPWQPGAQIACV